MTPRFNPAITVNGSTAHLHPLGIAVFLRNELHQPVASAKHQLLEIETALDMLLRGY
jgi:hypothetical protein